MAEPIHDAQRLLELQALPLERKIQITQTRIIEWYQHYKGNVCVSFSGGKDSTVLLHIARQIYPNIPAVFSNTGLEYASIQKFVRTWDNVNIVVPKMKFNEVVTQYGYPLISKDVAQCIYEARQATYIRTRSRFYDGSDYNMKYKNRYSLSRYLPLLQLPIRISHLCCNLTKKKPIKRYMHQNNYKEIIATLAEESELRRSTWIKNGCNAFDSKTPKSQPLSFWTEQDVLSYLVLYDVPLASIYGDIVGYDLDGNYYEPLDLTGKPMCNLKCTGFARTGCAFCAFGLHLEKNKKTRFQLLKEIEPKKYEYAVGGGAMD